MTASAGIPLVSLSMEGPLGCSFAIAKVVTRWGSLTNACCPVHEALVGFYSMPCFHWSNMLILQIRLKGRSLCWTGIWFKSVDVKLLRCQGHSLLQVDVDTNTSTVCTCLNHSFAGLRNIYLSSGTAQLVCSWMAPTLDNLYFVFILCFFCSYTMFLHLEIWIFQVCWTWNSIPY